MKIARFDSMTLAEKGVEFEIPDPVTKLPSGVVFTLLGADSKTYQGALDEIMKRNRTSKGIVGITNDDSIEILSRCVVGWSGLEDEKGKEIPFSQSKAKEILRDYPYLLKVVSDFVTTRENFFQKP